MSHRGKFAPMNDWKQKVSDLERQLAEARAALAEAQKVEATLREAMTHVIERGWMWAPDKATLLEAMQASTPPRKLG